jgi:hypothetical protein
MAKFMALLPLEGLKLEGKFGQAGLDQPSQDSFA